MQWKYVVLQYLVIGPGLGLEGPVLGPGLGLEPKVLVNITERDTFDVPSQSSSSRRAFAPCCSTSSVQPKCMGSTCRT